MEALLEVAISVSVAAAAAVSRSNEYTSSDSEDDTTNLLRAYYENDNCVLLNDRVAYIITITAGGIVEDLMLENLKDEPFTFTKAKKLRPTCDLVRKEVVCRDPNRKNLNNKKLDDLINILKSLSLSTIEKTFVTNKFNELKEMLRNMNKEKEKENNNSVNRLDLIGHLRIIYYLLEDDVFPYYLQSQDALTRQELDARNAANVILTVWQRITDKFNDAEYVPISSMLPDLHITFAEAMVLEKPDYDIIAAKVKDFFLKAKPRLWHIITNYEQSSNGTNQRSEDAGDWGYYDIDVAITGDDRENYISGPIDIQLLYMWDMLDKAKILRFTCIALLEWMKVNASVYQYVSQYGIGKSRTEDTESRAKLASSVKKLGEGVSCISEISLLQKIDNWEQQKYKLEMDKLNYDEETHPRQLQIIAKRKRELDTKITDAKKKCKALDRSQNT